MKPELPSRDAFKWWDDSDLKPWSTAPSLSDNAQKPETLIYGPKGESLMERVPRPVGFRPERAK